MIDIDLGEHSLRHLDEVGFINAYIRIPLLECLCATHRIQKRNHGVHNRG